VREKNALKRFATAEVRAIPAFLASNTDRPEDVAQQVKCLALSKSVTGINIVIDAGFSL
jgi:hypothetical protein